MNNDENIYNGYDERNFVDNEYENENYENYQNYSQNDNERNSYVNNEQSYNYEDMSSYYSMEKNYDLSPMNGEIPVNLGQNRRRKSEKTSLSKTAKTTLNSRTIVRYTWKLLRPISIFIVAVIITFGIGFGIWTFVDDSFLKPVNVENPQEVVVEIPMGSSLGAIARILKENELVKNKGIFQYYAEFKGYGQKMRAGQYTFTQDMSMDDIMLGLMDGEGKRDVARVTFIEGRLVSTYADLLVKGEEVKNAAGEVTGYKNQILENNKTFIELISDLDYFVDEFDFLQPILENENLDQRIFALEGYLFPDTYELFLDSDEEIIIKKMLTRFGKIFTAEMRERAVEMNMTIDEVVILASIIQGEGRIEDMAKVSAVFHNKLKAGQMLGSDVTVHYATGIRKMALSDDDFDVVSPYNTYKVHGYPPGPVSNPGKDAIVAALYPDEEALRQGYMYFCSKDPDTMELHFSITYEEHLEAAKKYRPAWQKYDEQNADKVVK